MKLFRYDADKLPVAIIMSLSLVDLLVYLLIDNRTFVFCWFLIGLVPKVCICAWNHHHQHCLTFHQQPLNRLLELCYAFHTGITTNAWVLHHNLGHHVNYLDQTKDEAKWMRKDGTTMGCVEYTLKLAWNAYFDAYKVGKKHPRFQKSFITMGTVVALLLTGLTYFNWFSALILFATPMLIGYVFTCWHTYFHHAGLETDNHLEASYNIMHRGYNLLTGNLGYHTAHHMKQALHWSHLPEMHAKIVDQIPKHLFREPSIPFRWFPG